MLIILSIYFSPSLPTSSPLSPPLPPPVDRKPRSIERRLKLLPHWKGDGRNHLVVDLRTLSNSSATIMENVELGTVVYQEPKPDIISRVFGSDSLLKLRPTDRQTEPQSVL